jgi:hypothetical protein
MSPSLSFYQSSPGVEAYIWSKRKHLCCLKESYGTEAKDEIYIKEKSIMKQKQKKIFMLPKNQL